MSTDPLAPTLLLDVMGTLVYEPFQIEIPAFFGMSLKELLHAKDPTAWSDFESGAIDEPTLERRFFQDRRRFDLEGLKGCMRAAFSYLDGIEELLRDLSAAGVEMHALSNYAPWYSLIEERLELSRYLAWSFVSCDTGVRKPDPEAFLGAARRLGRRPEACLLVDDRLENCAAARRVGLEALHFSDARSLRSSLALLGVLPG